MAGIDKQESNYTETNNICGDLVNLIPFGIMIFDVLESGIIFVDDMFCDIFECDKEEIFEKSALLFSPKGEITKERLQLFLKTLTGEIIPISNEFKITKKDGSEVCLYLSDKYMRNKAGYIEKVVLVVNDITEMNKNINSSEISGYRYKEIFENSPNMIVLLDTQGKILKCNKATEDILEVCYDELIGKSAFELGYIPVEIFPQCFNHFFDLLKGTKIEKYLLEIKTSNSKSKLISISPSVISTEKNTKIIQVVCNDITSIIEDEQKSKQQLIEFVSLISHELRTPLTIIKGYFELFLSQQQKSQSPKPNNHFRTVEKNIFRLQHLLDSISDFTRTERGQFKINKEVVNIKTLIHNVFYVYKPLLQDQIELHYNLPEDELFLSIDPLKMAQVYDNVIQNAMRHTSSKSRNIIVECSVVQSRFFRTRIIDNGSGISSDKIDQLFKPFVSFASKYAVQSTGIGLYISKVILDRHQGSIKISSEGEDKGTEVIIELPIST